MGETSPHSFMDIEGVTETRKAASALFRRRDPDGIVAQSVAEWRGAWEALREESLQQEEGFPLRVCTQEAALRLAERARWQRASAWPCELCRELHLSVRELSDLAPVAERCRQCWRRWGHTTWACADCIVGQLIDGPVDHCTCSNQGRS